MKFLPENHPVLDLCGGIGGFMSAARLLGLPIAATAEINEDANTVALLNGGKPSVGDIRLLKGCNLPTVKIVLAGSPCQGWSHIGSRLGLAHPEGDILLHCIRLAQECEADLIVAENVVGITNHAGGRSLEIINEFLVNCGFTPFEGRILNSAHWEDVFTARKRWYACSFRQGLPVRPLEWPAFKKPPSHIRQVLLPEEMVKDLHIKTNEFIDEHREPPKDPYAPWRVGYIRKIYRERMIWSLDAPAPTFMAMIGGPGGPSSLYRTDDGRIRTLHPIEMVRAMGFPEGFRMPFRGVRGGRLVGNSLCPPVAKSVIAMALKAMTGEELAA